MKISINLFILFITIIITVTGSYCPSSLFESKDHKGSGWTLLSEAPEIAEHAAPLESIVFFDQNDAIATSAITIVKTYDGGKSLLTVKRWDDDGFSKIINYNGQLWIVGSHENRPTILNTKEQGFDWNQWKPIYFSNSATNDLDNSFDYFRDICFSSPTKAWVVGDQGMVGITFNGGNWEISDLLKTQSDIYGVLCTKFETVWAVGDGGRVYLFDSGWRQVNIPFREYDFKRIVSFNDEIWLLGGRLFGKGEGSYYHGIALRSKDHGKTWENLTPRSANFLNDIVIYGSQGWLIGNGGEIYYSNNSGNTWRKTISPTKNDLLQIYFRDSENMWIVGGRTSVLKYEQNP